MVLRSEKAVARPPEWRGAELAKESSECPYWAVERALLLPVGAVPNNSCRSELKQTVGLGSEKGPDVLEMYGSKRFGQELADALLAWMRELDPLKKLSSPCVP